MKPMKRVIFLKGMTLDFTISAPGYASRSVAYEVKNDET